MNRKKIADFFTSGLGLLILGFVLTTICGSFINWSYTKATWKRDKDFELFKAQLVKDDELLTSLSKTMGARLFRLQRVLWNLDRPGSEAPGEMWRLDDRAKREIEQRWADYYTTVVDWNLTYRDYKRRLQLLAGDDLAAEFFLAGEQGARTAKEGSILGAFEGLHSKVKTLNDKAKESATVGRAEHDAAQADIDRLYNKVDEFMARLSKKFQDEERSQNPLESRRSKD